MHNNRASELLSNWARKTCLKLLPIHTVTLSGGLNHTYSMVQAKRSNQLATCQVADARVKDNVNIKIKDNNTNIITLINNTVYVALNILTEIYVVPVADKSLR